MAMSANFQRACLKFLHSNLSQTETCSLFKRCLKRIKHTRQYIRISGQMSPQILSTARYKPLFALHYNELEVLKQTTLPCLSHNAYKCISSKTKEIQNDVPTKEEINTGWILRLSNENTYLSWCRNSYIAGVCSVGMFSHGAQVLSLPHATEAGVVMFTAGALNLMLGTSLYVHNTVSLHKVMHMRKLTATIHVSMAMLHTLLWIMAVYIFMGYIEMEEENEKIKPIQ